ncbi:MAG: hypothetical protein WC119_08835 [Synergistaceae bacterium]
MNNEVIFKECSTCGQKWATSDSFIMDRNIEYLGHQEFLDEGHSGYFLFNHINNDCRTTIAIPVESFHYLYKGEKYIEDKHGSKECPKYCFQFGCDRVCDNECSCRWIQEVIHIIKEIQQDIRSI